MKEKKGRMSFYIQIEHFQIGNKKKSILNLIENEKTPGMMYAMYC